MKLLHDDDLNLEVLLLRFVSVKYFKDKPFV